LAAAVGAGDAGDADAYVAPQQDHIKEAMLVLVARDRRTAVCVCLWVAGVLTLAIGAALAACLEYVAHRPRSTLYAVLAATAVVTLALLAAAVVVWFKKGQAATVVAEPEPGGEDAGAAAAAAV
jgi:hypothetical protein